MIRLGNFEKLDSCSTLVDCSSSLELQSLSKDNPLLASKPASVLPAIPACIWPAVCVSCHGLDYDVCIVLVPIHIFSINISYLSKRVSHNLAVHTHWWRTLRDFFTKKLGKVKK